MLIVFEGLDGAGKSTQSDNLSTFLADHGIDNIKTRWNSSLILRKAIKKAKRNKNLVPVTYSLIHATDFYDRQERTVKPSLKDGVTVVADRWFYTGLARDVARGVPENYVNGLYTLALKPDIIFYLRMDLKGAYQRIHQGRQPHYWEAGMDTGVSKDLNESYVIFTQRLIQRYEQLARQHGFIPIDANRPPQEVTKEVQDKILKVLQLHGHKSSSPGEVLRPVTLSVPDLLASRR